jgi:hypothetical protein
MGQMGERVAHMNLMVAVGHTSSPSLLLRTSCLEAATCKSRSSFLGRIAERLRAGVRRHTSTSESSPIRRRSRPQE